MAQKIDVNDVRAEHEERNTGEVEREDVSIDIQRSHSDW